MSDTSSDKVYDFALVGYGKMGEKHAELIKWLPGARLIAICDTWEESLTRAKRAHPSVETYTDVSAMLEAECPDVVVIATHANYHAEPAVLAAAAGAHVLCEKPIAANLEEADAMVAAFQERGLTLAVNHQWRVGAAAERAKELLDEGAIGEVVSVHAGFGKGRPAGYELAEMGTHVFDMVCKFAGAPASCVANIVYDGRPATVADIMNGTELLIGGRDCGLVAGAAIAASFQFESGVIMHAEAFGAEGRTVKDRIEVDLRGTKGKLKLSGGAFEKLTQASGAYATEWADVPLHASPDEPGLSARANSMLPLYLDLFTSIETGAPHPCSGENARTALEMIGAVYVSHFTGVPTRLPLDERGDYLESLRTKAASLEGA